MIIQAISKFTRISPKKLREIVYEVKKKPIDEVLNILTFSKKKGANLIKKTLESAISNAKNNYKIDKENLFIKTIDINSGIAFKRWRPVSRGGVHQYKKRTSHIRVVLEEIKSTPQQDIKLNKKDLSDLSHPKSNGGTSQKLLDKKNLKKVNTKRK